MKKIIRLTESELMGLISRTAKRIIREDVLGDNWHEAEEDSVLNNYEPFEDQMNDDPFEGMYGNQEEHNWSGQGEEDIDPTYYDDPDIYSHNINGIYNPSDGDLERGW